MKYCNHSSTGATIFLLATTSFLFFVSQLPYSFSALCRFNREVTGRFERARRSSRGFLVAREQKRRDTQCRCEILLLPSSGLDLKLGPLLQTPHALATLRSLSSFSECGENGARCFCTAKESKNKEEARALESGERQRMRERSESKAKLGGDVEREKGTTNSLALTLFRARSVSRPLFLSFLSLCQPQPLSHFQKSSQAEQTQRKEYRTTRWPQEKEQKQ